MDKSKLEHSGRLDMNQGRFSDLGVLRELGGKNSADFSCPAVLSVSFRVLKLILCGLVCRGRIVCGLICKRVPELPGRWPLGDVGVDASLARWARLLEWVALWAGRGDEEMFGLDAGGFEGAQTLRFREDAQHVQIDNSTEIGRCATCANRQNSKSLRFMEDAQHVHVFV